MRKQVIFLMVPILLLFAFKKDDKKSGFTDTSKWKLVWSDEFNYKGHPNPEKWGYEQGYVRHNELQYYTPYRLENSRVDGKNLIIELRKETPESFVTTSMNDDYHRYTAASVTTRDLASWTYGRFEIRAKAPEGKGTWPAIWFLCPIKTPNIPGPPLPRLKDGREDPGPVKPQVLDSLGRPVRNQGGIGRGELDLMESWGSKPNRTTVFIHGTQGKTPSARYDHPYNIYKEFCVYAMEWFPDHIDFFRDDVKILTYTKDPKVGWSFDQPMYLIMNIACGGPDEPAPDDTKIPQFMTVDYVRVYKLIE